MCPHRLSSECKGSSTRPARKRSPISSPQAHPHAVAPTARGLLQVDHARSAEGRKPHPRLPSPLSSFASAPETDETERNHTSWRFDITEIATVAGPYYLAPVIDSCSRRIVGRYFGPVQNLGRSAERVVQGDSQRGLFRDDTVKLPAAASDRHADDVIMPLRRMRLSPYMGAWRPSLLGQLKHDSLTHAVRSQTLPAGIVQNHSQLRQHSLI